VIAAIHLREVLQVVAAIGTLGSLFFYALSAMGISSFLAHRRRLLEQPTPSENQLPPVTILKPLKGIDPEIGESFRSHCEQQYPEFQLVFGVSDPDDPAIALVRNLQIKYPKLPIELVVCSRVLGPNIKLSNLAQMLPSARHELLLVNDSDIRVPKDYLQNVAAPFVNPSVGLVTCLYRGLPGATLGSRLEALSLSTDFIPGVLSARFLEGGLHFGLGSTLAFRRKDLIAIGGFEALLDCLADDYELGRRIASTGKKIELCAATVTTFLPAYTLRQFFRHQLRWSRTIRDARSWGYAGLLLTFGLPWALVTLLAARGAPWAWILLALTLVMRLVVAFSSSVFVLDDHQFLRDILLLPVRDMLAPFIWAASFMGNRVHWRGEVFDLKDGRLTTVKPPPD
jgi:ceramide glucosyltransferase